jgi:hypothetical protein
VVLQEPCAPHVALPCGAHKPEHHKEEPSSSGKYKIKGEEEEEEEHKSKKEEHKAKREEHKVKREEHKAKKEEKEEHEEKEDHKAKKVGGTGAMLGEEWGWEKSGAHRKGFGLHQGPPKRRRPPLLASAIVVALGCGISPQPQLCNMTLVI